MNFRSAPRLTVALVWQLIDGGQRVQDVAAITKVGRVTLYRAFLREIA